MTAIQELAKKIEVAFVEADLNASVTDEGRLGYRHLAFIAAVVMMEQGLLPAPV